MESTALIEVADRAIGDETVQTVNARELHAFLMVGTAFTDWLPRRVEEFGFVQDVDFVRSFMSVDEGGDGKTQYHLSLDMAKELSMVERNAQGKKARQYFIECERCAKAAPVIDLSDPAFLRSTLLTYTEKVIALEAKVAEQAPKAEFHDKYAVADGNKGFREVAKLLDANEREFRQFLISNSIMYRLGGRLMPMAHHQHAGRFVVKTGVSEANSHAFNQAMFTPKGISWVAGEWAKFHVESFA